jgi:hypothetical protein
MSGDAPALYRRYAPQFREMVRGNAGSVIIEFAFIARSSPS